MPDWEVPEQYKEIHRRAMEGKSRLAGIKDFCLQCMGYEAGAKKMVRECASVQCALHPYRPYQLKEKDPTAPKGVFPGRRKGEVAE